MRDGLKIRIAEALAKAGVSVVPQDVSVEYPADLAHGDYSSSVAMKFAKQSGRSPRSLAEEITASLGTIPGIAKIEVVGAFINFYLAPEEVARVAEEARSNDLWGNGSRFAGKRIMVEYTDPNPFKEFHIGHLMSNAIGESIARLVQFAGADVRRANYQGDVGPHVAKALWGMRKIGADPHDASAIGVAYATGGTAYENDPAAKQEIDAINAKVYDRSDVALNDLYAVGRAASLEHFEEIYKVLGTKFDFYFFESEAAPRGVEIVRAHPQTFEGSDGAVVYKGEKVGLHTRVFLTSKGLPTYEAKELALAEMKKATWPADISITITAHEQADYFKVVLAAMKEVMPDFVARIRHVSHGMMRLPSGKMSSRTGDVITGESLLRELVDAARVRAAESRSDDAVQLAQDIAVAAIKYQVLKQASGKDIIFDRERALSLEGDSGPYLQYAHARACAVSGKAKEQGVKASSEGLAATNLARLVYRFPEAVDYAASAYEPHLLTNYLLELASTFNTWYAQVHILDGSTDAPQKVALVEAVRDTLRKGLWILGIPAPDKM